MFHPSSIRRPDQRRLARLAAATMALGVALAAARGAGAHEQRWEPQPQRRSFLAGVADRYGMSMGTASPHTTAELNRFLGASKPLPAQNVRITSYSTWQRMAEELGCHVVGGAVTPHQGGPHLYSVAGHHMTDTIDAEANATFYDTGTKARRQRTGASYHYPRVFMLWKAPVSALTAVGVKGEQVARERATRGYNCGVLMAGSLADEGRAEPTSPFSEHTNTLKALARPIAESALRAVGKVGPDLVVQVLPDADFRNVQANWQNHTIDFWY